MTPFIHRYFLKRKKIANSQTTESVQKGALLKIVDLEGDFGVADICPWPSLGDLTLEQELELQGPLFQRAWQLAQKDLQARKNKTQLNSAIPVKNHFLIQDLDVDVSIYRGDTVKIKGDRDIQKMAQFLNLKALEFKSVRLDFNGVLDADLYFQFLHLLSEETLRQIECVEDPFPFDKKLWSQSPVKIAEDFLKTENWPFKVIKPARSQVDDDALYLTSSMDHPVGLAHGLVEAQKKPDLIHGFLTLNQYEETPFHKYFKQEKNELSFENEGYGIGFDQELKDIVWEPWMNYKSDSQNQIFYAPHLSWREKNDLEQLKKYFDKNVSSQGYFLIPSSGSSHRADQSLKLYALAKTHFLNSAERVNMEFLLSSDMNWGCVLPTYHVGGMSILARAHLAHSQVFFSAWKDFSVDWIKAHQIQLLSLVPTQLFDLVQNKVSCPQCLKHVFIGGADLSHEIEQSARDLGWPLVVTFGMTETASMFASRKLNNDFYQPFQGVEIGLTDEGLLKIKSNSLAECSLQIINQHVVHKNLIQNGYYESEDRAEIQGQDFRFLNRSLDQIKINGEGVSLFQLKQKLEKIVIEKNLKPYQAALISIPDERQGESLLLVLDFESAKIKDQILQNFNQVVQPYERVQKTYTLQTPWPMTELNKIKYQQLKEIVLKNLNRENENE